MKCLLDMDGVLVDFVGGAAAHHGFLNPYLDSENQGIYHLETLWGVETDELFKGMEEEFWAGLQPMHDFRTIIRVVEEHFGPEEVCLLSSPTLNRGCMAGKLRWIEEWMPDYSRRYLFGAAKQFCAGPGSVLLDDHSKNTERFVEHGGTAILVPGPWNSNYYIEDRAAWIQEQLEELIRGY